MKKLEDVLRNIGKVREGLDRDLDAMERREKSLVMRFRNLEAQLEKRYSKKVKDLYFIDLERYMSYEDSCTDLDRGIARFFNAIEALFNHIEDVTRTTKEEEKKTFMRISGEIYSQLYFLEYDIRRLQEKQSYFRDLDHTLSNLDEGGKYEDYAKEIFG